MSSIVITGIKFSKVTAVEHITVTGATVAVDVDDDGVGTITIVLTTPATSVLLTMGKQLRSSQIDVYTA